MAIREVRFKAGMALKFLIALSCCGFLAIVLNAGQQNQNQQQAKKRP
jgi:hypothetical protein